MTKLAFNLPLNSTSLGQVSICILKNLFKRKESIHLFPIGNIDLSSQKDDPEFTKWISDSLSNAITNYKRSTPIFKLWHLNGSLESLSKEQVLLSFYEVDSPTAVELNIVRNNNKVLLSSSYAVSIFSNLGTSNVEYTPLGFDSDNFSLMPRKENSVIQFGLFGKLEPQRKRHLKTLSLWAKKYGNNPKYALNCAIFNNFIDPKVQSQIISQALNNQKYWNINFLPFLQDNSSYNALLNSIDIVLAMSGGEGWGLPEFQSVALGKHCLGLNAHSYKDWMTNENSVLIQPSSKIPVYDNMFFKQGLPFNQGQIFDWSEVDFFEGLEKVEARFNESPVNKEGLDLQNKFTYDALVDKIISSLKSI